MLLLTGVFDNVSVVLRQSLLQTGTPDYVKGRVLAFTSGPGDPRSRVVFVSPDP